MHDEHGGGLLDPADLCPSLLPLRLGRPQLAPGILHVLRPANGPGNLTHMFLRQNLTIKSHDDGKGGYFYNCGGTSINLQLTRSVPLVGQLSL